MTTLLAQGREAHIRGSHGEASKEVTSLDHTLDRLSRGARAVPRRLA